MKRVGMKVLFWKACLCMKNMGTLAFIINGKEGRNFNPETTPRPAKKKRNIRKMSNASLVSLSLESASLTSSLKDSVFGTLLDCLCLWKFIFVFGNLSLSL